MFFPFYLSVSLYTISFDERMSSCEYPLRKFIELYPRSFLPNGVREEHSKYEVGDFVQRRLRTASSQATEALKTSVVCFYKSDGSLFFICTFITFSTFITFTYATSPKYNIFTSSHSSCKML